MWLEELEYREVLIECCVLREKWKGRRRVEEG